MNKLDFLNAICGKAVQRTIDGIEVSIRSLTVLETQQIQDIKDPVEMSLHMIVIGLVEPKLELEDIAELKNSKAGFVAKLAKEISDVSGLSASDDSPTVGNG